MRSRQRVLVSPQKFWSQSQVGLSNRQGTWIQGLCFKLVTHWKLLTSGVFSLNLKGKCTVQGPILKEWSQILSYLHIYQTHAQQRRHHQGDRHPLAMRPLRRPRVWIAAQRAVCCGVSTLGGGRGGGQRRKESQVLIVKEETDRTGSIVLLFFFRLHLESRTPSLARLWTLSYMPSIYGNNIPTGKPDPTPHGRAPGFLPRLSVA